MALSTPLNIIILNLNIFSSKDAGYCSYFDEYNSPVYLICTQLKGGFSDAKIFPLMTIMMVAAFESV
jgi:hypothetical protein